MMVCVDWTTFGLPATLEVGEDGFPRPGALIQWSRARAKQLDPTWTQKRLAQELELTERAVYYLESQDVGLDSISLRRRLARLLMIPPLFLGLASLEDPVDVGQLIKQYRLMKPKGHPLRSQRGLAHALCVSEKAVREMEHHKKGLDSLTRRRLLAQLLEIPPAALGIVPLEEAWRHHAQRLHLLSIRAVNTNRLEVDPGYYEAHLKTLWNRNHMTTAQDRIIDLVTAMEKLKGILPYKAGEDEKKIYFLLCRYHHLYAHILRDQSQYEAALLELEKALRLAQRTENSPLLAVTYLRIGSVLRDRGTVYEALAKMEAARGDHEAEQTQLRQAFADYQAALAHYQRIRLLQQLPAALQGVLWFDEGYAQAQLAWQDRQKRQDAVSLLEQSEAIIAATRATLEEEFAIRITERTYCNTKAAAFLSLGWPREAMEILTALMDLPADEAMTRQNAYSQYLWAQAYTDLRCSEAAAPSAQEAAVKMKQIRSRLHLYRLRGLHAQLSQLDGSNLEVIRFGVIVQSERRDRWADGQSTSTRTDNLSQEPGPNQGASCQRTSTRRRSMPW